MLSSDCPRRARFDATLTRSAAVGNWPIRRQFERRQDFREKEPCPEPFIDQHGVFAVPADSGLSRVIAFQDRASIDVTFLLSTGTTKKIIHLVQLLSSYIVVIITPSVSSDASTLSIFCSGPPKADVACWHVTLEIIQRQNHNRLSARQNLLRIATLFFAAFHVIHLAVCVLAQPLAKFSCVRGRVANRYATRIETKLPRKGHELRFQFRSRSVNHCAVAGIDNPSPGLRSSLLSLLKIATATSSSVSTDVSTRRCAIFAYSGSRACNICANASLGLSPSSNGRFAAREARSKSVFSLASIHISIPRRFKRSTFSSRSTIPPPVTMIACVAGASPRSA